MDWSKRIDILSKLFTIAAIVVGGIWSYLKFIRGQLFAIRLKPKVEGKYIFIGESKHLLVTVQLTNAAASPVNLSKVIIRHEGSGLSVFTYNVRDYRPETHNVNWDRLATFPVFELHQWVEAGEEIKEQRLVPLPAGDYVAFKLELRIVSKSYVWNETSIIEGASQKDAQPNNSFNPTAR
jgi:hypothetical protein